MRTFNASRVIRGVLATARLGTGTANIMSVLRGNGTWGTGPITLMFATTAVHNPADTNAYYMGQPGLAASTTANTRRVYFPKAGTVVGAWVTWNAVSAAGTNESIAAALRINNTTDYTIASVADTAAYKNFVNTSINSSAGIAVNSLDYFEIKITPPAWVTNPTSVIYQGAVLFVPTT